jgi:hypothetical protein
MIPVAAAVASRQLSTLLRPCVLRAVSTHARADEVSGVVGVEVSLVDHVLGDLALGLALIKFGTHQMTSGDCCVGRPIGDVLRLQCSQEFVVDGVGASGLNSRTERPQ